MEKKPHSLRAFDKALDSLNKNTLKVFSSSYLSLQLAHKALITRDSDLANQIIAEDDEIDELNKTIVNQALNILACFSPVSTDLRFVLALSSLSRHLERLGDKCVSIARHTLKLNSISEIREVRLVEPIFLDVLKQTSKIRKDFELRDFDAIRGNSEFHNSQSTTISSLTEHLAKLSEQEPVSIPALAELIFISRSLENIWSLLEDINEEMLSLE